MDHSTSGCRTSFIGGQRRCFVCHWMKRPARQHSTHVNCLASSTSIPSWKGRMPLKWTCRRSTSTSNRNCKTTNKKRCRIQPINVPSILNSIYAARRTSSRHFNLKIRQLMRPMSTKLNRSSTPKAFRGGTGLMLWQQLFSVVKPSYQSPSPRQTL